MTTDEVANLLNIQIGLSEMVDYENWLLCNIDGQ